MNGVTVVELADKVCVASDEKRGVFWMKLKLHPRSHVCSAEVEREMQGRLCREVMPDLRADVEEVVLICRY